MKNWQWFLVWACAMVVIIVIILLAREAFLYGFN